MKQSLAFASAEAPDRRKRFLRAAPFGLLGLLNAAVTAGFGVTHPAALAVATALIVVIVVAIGLSPWVTDSASGQVVLGCTAFAAVYLLGVASGNPGAQAVLCLAAVLWFALYGTPTAAALAVLGALLTMLAPLALGPGPVDADATWRIALKTAIVAAAMAVSVSKLIEGLRRAAGRVQASERTARREATRLAAVLHGVTDYAIVGTSTKRVTFFSDGAERMLGYGADEVVGLLAPTHFHLEAEVAERAAALGVAAGPEAVVAPVPSPAGEREWTWVRKDGAHVPVAVTVTALSDTMPGGEYLLVARDVSRERLRARHHDTRERLMADLAEAPDLDLALSRAVHTATAGMGWEMGVLWMAEDGLLRPTATWAGAQADPDLSAAVAGLRMAPGEGMCGTAWRDDRPVWVTDLRDYDGMTDQTRAIRDSPAWQLRSGVCLPLRGRSEEPVGVLQLFSSAPREEDSALTGLMATIASEIGLHYERARGAAELRAARDEADSANRAKDEFLSTVSHELRTPLNAILGFGQLLSSDQSARPDLAGHITDAGRHLSDLIEDLLDIGTIERGDPIVSTADVDAAAVLAEALELVRPLAQEHGIEMAVDAHAGLLTTVIADRRRLRQVLINVIGNAVIHNYKGGKVSVAFERPDERWLTYVVSDTGPGIHPDDQQRVFEPMARVGADSAPGSGLGLSISRRLIAAMDGSLELESRTGRGATFRIRLRRGRPVTVPSQNHGRRRAAVPGGAGAKAGNGAVHRGRPRQPGPDRGAPGSRRRPPAGPGLRRRHGDRAGRGAATGSDPAGFTVARPAWHPGPAPSASAPRYGRDSGGGGFRRELAGAPQRVRRRGRQRLRDQADRHPRAADGDGSVPRRGARLMARSRVSVYVAEDHPIYLEGLIRSIRSRPELELIGYSDNGREALEAVVAQKPEVAVLDVRMPELDGTAIMNAIQRDTLPTAVLFLSAHVESSIVYEALSSGASGYLSKLTDGDRVCEAIEAVARGETVLPTEIQPALLEEIRRRRVGDRPLLTSREQQVLWFLGQGLTVPQMTEELHLGAATIRTHLQRLYEKLGVSTQAGAVAGAMRLGLLE